MDVTKCLLIWSSGQRRERHILESERWRSGHWKQHQNPWSGCKAGKSSPLTVKGSAIHCPLDPDSCFSWTFWVLVHAAFWSSLPTPHSICSSVHKTFWLSCSQLRTRSCRLFARPMSDTVHMCVIVLSPCLLPTRLCLFLLIAVHTTQLWDFSLANASPQWKVLQQGC